MFNVMVMYSVYYILEEDSPSLDLFHLRANL
jgi:hypothetical protein